MQLLLVEDSSADAELALVAIRRGGFGGAVTHIADGEKALAWLAQRAGNAAGSEPPLPCVVLLDLKLPGCDGFEFLRQVKGNPDLRLIPVVVFSSSREESDIVRAFGLGCNAFVVKPVDFGEYCETLALVVAFWTKLNEVPFNGMAPKR